MSTPQIQLFLTPQHNAKPEFLATLVSENTSLWSKLPPKLVLENYTRDAWAWKPSPHLTAVPIQSIDGKNKLPGFIDYLKQRQKSAYGRFESGIVVLTYVQTKSLTMRVALDLTNLSCGLPPLVPPKPISRPAINHTTATNNTPTTTMAPPKKKGGLLGSLVGAQQRTNQHVVAAAAVSNHNHHNKPHDNSDAVSGTSFVEVRTTTTTTTTAQQVLANVRQSLHDKLLEFDVREDDEQCTVHLSLAEHTVGLVNEDEKAKVTMDVLKYMVYEAAEEINEEWIVHKEPSEFMDEAEFSIYKEGAAPPDVLEEVNAGDLPDEVKQQQRAVANERQKTIQSVESRNQRKVMQQATKFDEEDDDVEVLNQKKRDRRTIADYEREKREQTSKVSKR